MELLDAEKLARRLMTEHGLCDWTFAFDRSKRRFGLCQFFINGIDIDRRGYISRTNLKGRIVLSAPLVLLNSPTDVRDTILHEIGHALVGHEHHHNVVWKQKAREIGHSGRRCYAAHVKNLIGYLPIPKSLRAKIKNYGTPQKELPFERQNQ